MNATLMDLRSLRGEWAARKGSVLQLHVNEKVMAESFRAGCRNEECLELERFLSTKGLG